MFVQSLEYALSCLLYSPVGNMIMTLATLIGSSPISLLIFTVLCVIGFIVGICMILYAAINYIIVSFGYKAHWDCLSYAKVGGKYCIHLFLEEIDL